MATSIVTNSTPNHKLTLDHLAQLYSLTLQLKDMADTLPPASIGIELECIRHGILTLLQPVMTDEALRMGRALHQADPKPASVMLPTARHLYRRRLRGDMAPGSVQATA